MHAPDARSRALVPVTGLGLLVLVCIVDATLRDSSPARASSGRPPDGGPRTGPGGASGLRLPRPPTIRVRLASAVRAAPKVTCGVDGAYRIVAGLHGTDDAPRVAIASGASLSNVTVAANKRGLSLNGVLLDHRAVTLIPGPDATVSVNGRRYRGTLGLEIDADSRVRVTNLVDLEEYVAGVLFAEMPERFDEEAQRAQAVTARTFALQKTLDGGVLRDDQGSQVYAGIDRETEAGRRVVGSTRGEIVTWNGAPFTAYFHSTCGGMTASARDVFAMSAPAPLAENVACDGCRGTRWSSWYRTILPAEIARLYRGAFGDALFARVARTDDAGRVLELTIVDTLGEVVDRPVADRFRNDYNSGRSLDRSLLSNWFTLRETSEGIAVDGRGFGHGVGLCQYGADGLASAGADYRGILSTYYPGATLARAYD